MCGENADRLPAESAILRKICTERIIFWRPAAGSVIFWLFHDAVTAEIDSGEMRRSRSYISADGAHRRVSANSASAVRRPYVNVQSSISSSIWCSTVLHNINTGKRSHWYKLIYEEHIGIITTRRIRTHNS